MANNGQSQIFAAMARPEFYPHPVAEIEQRETHISKVYLTGKYAYKIKKPVDLGFLDFTTLEKRCHFCHREVDLNRRLAPDIYLGVIPITLEKGRYFLAGQGPAVEFAVKMRQLSADVSMLHLLRRRKIDATKIQRLSARLTLFYQQAAVDRTKMPFGSRETVWANCEENFSQTERHVGKVIDERMYQIIRSATRSFLHKHREIFANRIRAGKVRDCHGDLRAGHIYFADGIKIIDCIEFNDRFRYADIACDLAFLAMDLDFEGFGEIEQQLLENITRLANDNQIFILIDFYKCYRAFVRVKVNCLRLAENNLGEYQRRRLLRETNTYLELAYRYALNINRPTLWMTCGIIGSGKSTIASALGQLLGTKVLLSDAVRKDLFGFEPAAAVEVPFGTGIYSEESNRLVYAKMLMLAQEEIKKGCSVILDATFSRQCHRLSARRLAENLDAHLIMVECVAGMPAVRQRLLARQTGRSVSDARLHHLGKFRTLFEPLTEEEQTHCIRVNTEGSVNDSLHKILSERRGPCLKKS